MIKVKCGAIIKEITEGSLKYYKMAGWKILEEIKDNNLEENKNDKTNTKKTITT